MYVVRMRDPRFIAGLLLMLGVAVFLLFFELTVQQGYSQEVLFTAGWGEGPGQMGQRPGADGNLYGPRSLALGPGGRIYVADTYNRRVAVYDRGGNLAASINLEGDPPPLVNDLAVGRDGRLFLADNAGQRILVYDAGGRPAGQLDLAGPGESDHWSIERAAVDAGGRLYVATRIIADETYQRQVSRLAVNSPEVSLVSATILRPDGSLTVGGGSLIGDAVNTFAVAGSRSRIYAESGGAGPFQRVIRVYDPEGRRLREFRLAQDKPLGTISLIGADDRGAIYLGTRLGTPDAAVLRFDAHGRLVARLGIPPGQKVLSNVYARVDGEGAIYYLSPGLGGVAVARARPVASWHVSLRN